MQVYGKPVSQTTGLYYFYHRWYDPSIGRFISQDPKPGSLTRPQSLNPYAYVQNCPCTLSDPTGEDWFGSLASTVLTKINAIVSGVINAFATLVSAALSIVPQKVGPMTQGSGGTTTSDQSDTLGKPMLITGLPCPHSTNIQGPDAFWAYFERVDELVVGFTLTYSSISLPLSVGLADPPAGVIIAFGYSPAALTGGILLIDPGLCGFGIVRGPSTPSAGNPNVGNHGH